MHLDTVLPPPRYPPFINKKTNKNDSSFFAWSFSPFRVYSCIPMRLRLFYIKCRWAVDLFFIVFCLFVLSFSQCFVFYYYFVLFYEQGEIDDFCLVANASILLPLQRPGYTAKPRTPIVKGEKAALRAFVFLLFQMFITFYTLRTFELALLKDLQTLFQMFITFYTLRTFELDLSKDLQTLFHMFITFNTSRTFELDLTKDLQTPRYYFDNIQMFVAVNIIKVYDDSVRLSSKDDSSFDDNSSMEFELTESHMDPFETVIPAENRFLFFHFNAFFNTDENQKLINFIKELPVGTDENVLLKKVRACAFDLIETCDLNRIERFEAQYPK